MGAAIASFGWLVGIAVSLGLLVVEEVVIVGVDRLQERGIEPLQLLMLEVLAPALNESRKPPVDVRHLTGCGQDDEGTVAGAYDSRMLVKIEVR